ASRKSVGTCGSRATGNPARICGLSCRSVERLMRLPIRIVIADDHALFRQGLRALLKHEPQVTIVGETGRADDVMALLAETPCDLWVLDRQREPNSRSDIEPLPTSARVGVLTASKPPADALAAIHHGARAVVFKRFAVESLMEAVRTVMQGDVWM